MFYSIRSATPKHICLCVCIVSVFAGAWAVETAWGAETGEIVEVGKRFPYFQSTPVPFTQVKMGDSFWSPRQKTIRDVTISWATRHYDEAGGLDALKKDLERYQAKNQPGHLEPVKFIEAMAVVVGLKRDADIERLIDAWGRNIINGQGADGYLEFAYPWGADPAKRWTPAWDSHEDYVLGHYLEAAIAYREATGRGEMYDSAVRAVDNMAAAFADRTRAYAPGHQEIEQALTRLYGMTGEKKYLQLCGWLIGQRGRHEGRPDFRAYSQDHIPVKEQRTIEGHAVRAAFLFNGVTEYVGATGDEDYRKTVLAVWDDFAQRKMYLHGGGGLHSASNEGYSEKPYHIPPGDSYGESCSVFGNFQWAHNLFRLTGEAGYLDTAERMLYNAFYASLSLSGDRFFYCNVMQTDAPLPRDEWHACPCCPPNIVKLFCKVGGFFYSTDTDGIYVKHYGASEADIPFGDGVKLTQRTDYPWSGEVNILVEPKTGATFTLRLRKPEWAAAYAVKLNGDALDAAVERGWLTIRREWQRGDKVELSLEMRVQRVTMPPQFKEYQDLAAIQRGPMVYCLEAQDVQAPLNALYLPEGTELKPEPRPDFLGGVTVLRGNVRYAKSDGGDDAIAAMFVPYAVWDNRTPGPMRVWLGARKPPTPGP